MYSAFYGTLWMEVGSGGIVVVVFVAATVSLGIIFKGCQKSEDMRDG